LAQLPVLGSNNRPVYNTEGPGWATAQSSMGTTTRSVHVTHWARRWFKESFHEFASTGLLVLAGWCFLTAAGLWRPRPTWADYLGRVLGIGWILVWVLKVLLFLPGVA